MAKKRSTAPETPPEGSASPPSGAETEQSDATEVAKTPWFRFTVMILFGIVYAWDLFAALSNFFGVLQKVSRINEVRALNNFSLIATPWVPILVNLLLPLVVFGLAVWVSRRRSVGVLAVVLFAGLGVVAAVSLSLTAYVLAVTPPL